MSALYWPDLECDALSRSIEHELTVHDHHDTEQAACLAFLGYRAATPATAGIPHPSLRYRCIRGPRGLIRGVKL